MNIRKTMSAGLVALALTASMGAGAAIKGTHNSVRVDLSDLDLTTANGEQAMHTRLERAARQVCGSTNLRRAGSLDNVMKNRACVEESLAAAVHEVEVRFMTAAN